MTPHRKTAMDGFELVKKRPQRFRCTLCAGAFIMDSDGMIRHAKEAEHELKVKAMGEAGWADWNGAGITWGREWGEQDGDELARWMPSKEELERNQAERDKREWILKWIEGVEGARLQDVHNII